MARRIMEEDQRIGNLLRVLRLKAGKSQTEIGQAIGVSFNRSKNTRAAQIASIADIWHSSPQRSGGELDEFFPAMKRRKDSETDMLMKLLADKQNLRALMAFAKIRPKLKAACLALLEEAAAGR